MTNKDLNLGISVTKKGRGAKDAQKELGDLERQFGKTATAASKSAVKTAALDAKTQALGRAVAKGKKSVEDAARELDKYKTKLNEAAKASEGATQQESKASQLWQKAKDNWQAIALGIGAVTAAAIAMKKVWTFAKEGQELRQLEQSFERLNEDVFKTPKLLEDMQAATRDTVSEAGLMSGILMLTAGASATMGQNFASAAPKLAEIAKAANKLNPTLGDTEFLFNSISTGIKRSSPLILDNLGLVIKVGDANKAMAAQLGKSVDELSAEEKQMALLNDVLRAGEGLIDQVGGNVDSLSDSMIAAEIATKDWKNGLLQLLGEALEPVGEMLNEVFAGLEATGSFKDIVAMGEAAGFTRLELDQLQAALIEARGGRAVGASAEDMRAAQKVILNNWTQIVTAEDQSVEALTKMVLEAQELARVEEIRRGNEAAWATTQAKIESDVARWNSEEIAAEEEKKLLRLENAEASRLEEDTLRRIDPLTRAALINIRNRKEAEEELVEVLEEEIPITERLARVNKILAESMHHLGKESGEYFEDAIDAPGITKDWNDELFIQAKNAGASAGELAELGVATGQFTEAQAEAALKTAILMEKVDQLAQAYVNDEISLETMMEDFNNFQEGLENKHIPLTEEGAERLYNMASGFDAVARDARIAHQDAVAPFLDELDNIPEEVNIRFKLHLPPIPQWLQDQITQEAATPQTVPESHPGGGGVQGHAGLSGIVPSGFPNDSFPLMVESGERVLVQTQEQQRQGVDVNGQAVGRRGGGGAYFAGDKQTFYVPDQSTARFVAHQIDEAKRQRYEEYMGKG